MAEHIMTDIFFRCANVAVVFGFFVYLLKSYILPALRQRIEEYHVTTARLNETFRLQKEINESHYDWYHERELLFEELKNKLDRWGTVQHVQAKESEKYRQGITIKLERMAQKTAHYQSLMLTKNMIAYQVLERARAVLEQKYAANNGSAYVDHAISLMKVMREKP